jgi:hypothetical protein
MRVTSSLDVGGNEVHAGKAGKYCRHDTFEGEGELITDWGKCVRNVTVSTKYAARFEIPGSVWQSCGSQGKVGPSASVDWF